MNIKYLFIEIAVDGTHPISVKLKKCCESENIWEINKLKEGPLTYLYLISLI